MSIGLTDRTKHIPSWSCTVPCPYHTFVSIRPESASGLWWARSSWHIATLGWHFDGDLLRVSFNSSWWNLRRDIEDVLSRIQFSPGLVQTIEGFLQILDGVVEISGLLIDHDRVGHPVSWWMGDAASGPAMKRGDMCCSAGHKTSKN